jgi:hypothetical protein
MSAILRSKQAPKEVPVKTQAEFDACVKAGNIALIANGYFEVSDSASVRAYDSASVRASGSASVRAYDSASVTASDSASVTAYDSASVRAFARVFVRLFSAIKITATAQVVIMREPNSRGDVEGGHIVQASVPKGAKGWCKEYEVKVKGGVAILYKGVNAEFKSDHGAEYMPGTIPVASDWDGGKYECGGGLHFSPCPAMTRQFANNALKFVACPVALKDMRAPQTSDEYPGKIKAKGCCAPTYEVDVDGKPVAATKVTA